MIAGITQRGKKVVAIVVDAGGYYGMGQFPPIPISRLLRAPQYGYGDVTVWIAEPCHKRRNRALSLTVLSVDSRFTIVKVRVKACVNGRRPDVLAQGTGHVSYRHPKIYCPSFLMVLVPHACAYTKWILPCAEFPGSLIQMVAEKYPLFVPKKQRLCSSTAPDWIASQFIDPIHNEQIALLYVWKASYFIFRH
ncbi:hypothetical protein ARMGADRAFT_1033475 [Armillaria gallica]|uniref:Uncharacterized protein n=1 Tax=Armillaria gallica TaxID=47427 RepID=A0A2H3D6Q2_ARMGA|nr:hypothetical protein ARMGADRAFT_1033475 [Armillaria gallica]